MTEKQESARALFLSGYNCSQSLFCAFCEDYGVPRALGAQLVSGLGGGMGRTRGVCGAVSSMVLVTGLARGYNTPDATGEKTRTYAMVQRLMAQFSAQYGTTICADLLGIPAVPQAPEASARTAEYYATRPCVGIITFAAGLVEQELSAATNE